jgi:hypothetical protein
MAIVGAIAACRDDVPTGMSAPVRVVHGPALATFGTTPALTQSTVNNTAGSNQLDPHVSGSLVSYVSNASGTNHVRYHDLATGADEEVPNSGEDDFLPDVSGSRIVFTRVAATSSIYLYDVRDGAPPSEIAPSTIANRNHAAIGGNTVAWQDFEFSTNALHAEIVAYDLVGATTTRLTNDAVLDRTPAVSPDGNVIVWAKCQTSGTGCDIWMAVKSIIGWTANAITGVAGEEHDPATDGQIVTYTSVRSEEADIYWQPVAGGTEQQIALTGVQRRPSVSAGLITFESREEDFVSGGHWDVLAYHTATDVAFPLRTAPVDETLQDVWVSSAGLVRVVYTAATAIELDVYALSFQLPGDLFPVEIDVIPGSPPFPIKLSGFLPYISVIVRTTATFDAALIKPATATLGDGLGSDAAVATTHKGLVLATRFDVDKDGDEDLVLAFKKADLATELKVGEITLVFRAELTGGGTARGEDLVKVIQ